MHTVQYLNACQFFKIIYNKGPQCKPESHLELHEKKLIVKEDHYIIAWNNLFGEVITVHFTDYIIGLKNSMHWLSKHFDSYT